jgi:hypothetical protein
MTDRDDTRLLRHLHGELSADEAQRLRCELAANPGLAARLAELETAWRGLELPPPTAPPPGWAARMARLAGDGMARGAGSPFGLGVAPAWAKTLVAASLAGGLLLGLGLGERLQLGAGAVTVAPPPAAVAVAAEETPDAAPAIAPAEGARATADGASHAAGDGGDGGDGSDEGAAAALAAAAEPAPREPSQAAAESAETVREQLALAAPPESASPDGGSDEAAALLGGDSTWAGGSTLAEAYWDAFAGGEAGW